MIVWKVFQINNEMITLYMKVECDLSCVDLGIQIMIIQAEAADFVTLVFNTIKFLQ